MADACCLLRQRRRLLPLLAALLAGLRAARGQHSDAYLAPVAASRTFGSSAAHRNAAWEAATRSAKQNLRAAPFRLLVAGDAMAYGCGDLAFYRTQCDSCFQHCCLG